VEIGESENLSIEGEDSAGVIRSGDAVVRNRVLNAVSILLPLAATGFALLNLEWLTPTLTTAAIFSLFFVMEMIGLGIGLHRFFAHRSFKTIPAIHWLLAIWATWAFQGPIERWVADHRRHHRFADGALDPHSPWWRGGKVTHPLLGGLFHAHIGWMFNCSLTDASRYAADIRSDPAARWCTRHYWLLCASSILFPTITAWAIGGVDEGMRGFFWGGFARVALLQQLTWCVNSIGHCFGERVPESKDESRNIPLFAILLFGEGLHNYHHLHPTVAVNRPELLDAGGHIIRLLECVGLVWDVRREGFAQQGAAK